MSWAETKKINSDMTKPLDKLITEKTNIKIQTVNIEIPSFTSSYSDESVSKTVEIDEIDTSKSIIYPLYLAPTHSGYDIVSVSYELSSNSIKLTVGYDLANGIMVSGFTHTVQIITFGS